MVRREYIIARGIVTLAMIFLTANMVFIVMQLLPGDPVNVCVPDAPLETKERMRHEFGLDRPLYIQYIDFLNRVFTFNFGRTWVRGYLVSREISAALPPTIELTLLGMFFGVIVGFVCAIVSVLRRDKILDHIIRLLSMIGYAIPVIWSGPLLQLFFGVKLGILPVSGHISSLVRLETITGFVLVDALLTGNYAAIPNWIAHMILPVICLGLFLTGIVSRVCRAEILTILQSNYIITARAKGLTESGIVFKHVLKNAILPVITVIGMQTATLFGGTLIVETVFNLPGMGSLTIYAFSMRDFPLMQACIMISAFWIGVTTFLIDIVYSIIDPRIVM